MFGDLAIERGLITPDRQALMFRQPDKADAVAKWVVPAQGQYWKMTRRCVAGSFARHSRELEAQAHESW